MTPINILPGADLTLTWINVTGPVTEDKIVAWPANPQNPRAIFPFIVGCFYYKSGAMPEVHQTGFIFEVQRQQENPREMPGPIHFGENVPANKVLIRPFPFFTKGKDY